MTTRVFENGNSQAVRIPKAFKLNTQEVQISLSENGDLILHPIQVKRGDQLLSALMAFDDDYISSLENELIDKPAIQERESL